MKFRRARSYFGRQYQRAAIARAYAQGWREANPAELGIFLKTVNDDFAGRPWADWEVTVNERRRTVTLSTSKTAHRATLKPGVVLCDDKGYRPISADNVAKFQYRMRNYSRLRLGGSMLCPQRPGGEAAPKDF